MQQKWTMLTGRMRAVGLAAAMAATTTVALPAGASAGELSIKDGTVTFQAAPGEVNQLRIAEHPPPLPGIGATTYEVSDQEDARVTAGSGCTVSPLANSATCPATDASGGVVPLVLRLEDRPDRLDRGNVTGVVIAYMGSDADTFGATGGDPPAGSTTLNVAYGEGGDDYLKSTSAPSRHDGGPGHDQIGGWTGDDELDGGDGSDRLFGVSGDDVLRGGAGNDDLNGESGKDELDGGPGVDSFEGFARGEGDDLLLSRDGNAELLHCGPGSDRAIADPSDYTNSFSQCEEIDRAVPPTAITGAASNVSNVAATVSGTVNPNGMDSTYWFEYGTATGTTLRTAAQPLPAGLSDVAVSTRLTRLHPHTTYSYRLVAENAAGLTRGEEATVTTGKSR